MLNVELLQKAKQWILEHPEHLDMDYGITRTSCGTAACIAGTLCMLNAPVPVEEILERQEPWDCWSESVETQGRTPYEGKWFPIRDRAMELLGITKESAADKLFQLSYWEDGYRRYYREAVNSQERARVVADYIDGFIVLVQEGAIAI